MINIRVNIKDQARRILTAVMLVKKITSNIFFTSDCVCPSPPSLKQDICYVKVGV